MHANASWTIGETKGFWHRNQQQPWCNAGGRGWTQAQIAAASEANVAVLYASAYGNTAALAQAISRGITKAGAARCGLLCP